MSRFKAGMIFVQLTAAPDVLAFRNWPILQTIEVHSILSEWLGAAIAELCLFQDK